MNDTPCYRFEPLFFSNGMLELDATYVIHLEGNGRKENITKQLQEYHPTKVVYILYNKGCKNCNKSLPLNEPQIDLIHAFLYVFQDAMAKHYKNILILEDDFMFDEKIKDRNVQFHITNFIREKENEPILYMLGCLPFLQKPYDEHTNLMTLGMGTHACIYNQRVMEQTLQENSHDFMDWDVYMFLHYPRYMYHESLCYQLFPVTENQQHWESFHGLADVFVLLLRTVQLDTAVEPGYTIFYTVSKLLGGWLSSSEEGFFSMLGSPTFWQQAAKFSLEK